MRLQIAQHEIKFPAKFFRFILMTTHYLTENETFHSSPLSLSLSSLVKNKNNEKTKAEAMDFRVESIQHVVEQNQFDTTILLSRHDPMP